MSKQYPASIKYTAEKGWILPPVKEAAPNAKSAPKRKPRAKSKPKE